MEKDELLRYAGHRNGYICVDLRFDLETTVVRAIQIHFLKGSWSISLNYLPYERLEYLPDEENPNLDGADRLAILRGKYASLDEIIRVLEEYLDRPLSQWHNFSRHGYYISLDDDELLKYKSIDWATWIPQKILVPEGSDYEIVKPASWFGRVKLETKP